MKFITFFFILLFNTSIYSNNFATVDLDLILNKSISYQVFIDKINDFIKKESLEFQANEIILTKNKADIESKKSILNENDFNNLISNYNMQLNIYQNNIANFNSLVDQNIETNKTIIIDKIVEILKKISIQNDYDFILTNNDYLLAKNKFDISNLVINKLNEYNILLDTYNVEK